MARRPGITTTKPALVACTLVSFSLACGARTVDADTDGASESTGGSESGGTTVGTTMPATSTITTDPSTDPATTDAVTSDASSESGAADSSTGASGSNGCCEVHDAAGCNEDAVVQCVCEDSPDCCVFGWEKNCVEQAMNRCAATCMGGEESGSESGGPMGGACDEDVVIELGASDAALMGDWSLVMSMLGEGMVAAYSFDPVAKGDDIVHWEIDVPCDDDWYIWVRGRDEGNDDSYFATLDGEPNPPPIFEADCTMGGDGYVWKLLNQRDPEAMACDYVEDPWIATWDAGTHAFDLGFRDAIAVARIVVTNDETYVPE